MSQSVALKKKGSNLNKAQSPLKNMNFDMQYRSSIELANQFKIKREKLANERNDKAKKEHAPIAHKRKNSEDFIPQQGKSKLVEDKSVIQSSSRKELSTSYMVPNIFPKFASRYVIGETLGNAEEQHDIKDLLNFKHVKRKSVLPATSLDQFLEEQQLQKEHDINDLPNCKQRYTGDETKTDNHTVADDLVDQEKIGGDKCAIDEEIGIDCSTKGILEPKKVRGKITCKDIHARNLEERKEVTFDKGQAVGPTGKIVSELTNFIGTILRNPRFINLMYTNWYAVSKDTKKRMWKYINSKFLIPVKGKKWVMTGLRDAWRQHKQKIKERCFDKNSTVEDMVAKRLNDMPEGQFRQLIKYWKHPTVQRATKENNKEPSKCEMFIATRTKTGKDIQADTQVAIAELQNHQNFGKTIDDAFTAVFGKEQPGRLRCYGRSVTTSSLKKDEETNELKQKHANEITSLKKK
ncbi:hypothetical protein H5410_062938 [Solanum commersonii]|uniref:Uncharacterized protein n=1 Tax=Solanum commersonii TaxID=4109 RepID=A0A9J5WCZ3_SOLCO|nr:hypothetical protein H5410_062938 [Solanum commersonii]